MPSTMRIQSKKIYIDYLDYAVSHNSITDLSGSIDRLRFDLLLFSEDTLCMSVPACVKLSSTTELLMKLTPFWDNAKIQLVLDRKHQNNPWNYFNNRKAVLERSFSEEQLNKHFEYIAYNSSHTEFFYNVYIKEILQPKHELYIGKVFDTDNAFRDSVISQVEHNIDQISDAFFKSKGNSASFHMSNILNDFVLIAQDRQSLFQRSAVEQKLSEENKASFDEICIIRKMLDKGFAYANGISCYAAPISLITNRLTGKTFIEIIRTADIELYDLIHNMDWNALYRLSVNDTWLDFVDHLNCLLLLYQRSEKRGELIFSPSEFEYSLGLFQLVKKLYETAFESLEKKAFVVGSTIIDVKNIKETSDRMIDYLLTSKMQYWNIIREIQELIPALKVVIRSLNCRYKGSTISLNKQGFIVTLDNL